MQQQKPVALHEAVHTQIKMFAPLRYNKTTVTCHCGKQKEQMEQTLTQLKAAQAQLLHQEKMAALGELTAGIVHEIQNPLSFISNFSESNRELLEEMMHELENGNIEAAKVLAGDVRK